MVTLAFVHPYVADTSSIFGAVLSILTVKLFVDLFPTLSIAVSVYLLEPSVLKV